jgi:hypothetical protein
MISLHLICHIHGSFSRSCCLLFPQGNIFHFILLELWQELRSTKWLQCYFGRVFSNIFSDLHIKSQLVLSDSEWENIYPKLSVLNVDAWAMKNLTFIWIRLKVIQLMRKSFTTLTMNFYQFLSHLCVKASHHMPFKHTD